MSQDLKKFLDNYKPQSKGNKIQGLNYDYIQNPFLNMETELN